MTVMLEESGCNATAGRAGGSDTVTLEACAGILAIGSEYLAGGKETSTPEAGAASLTFADLAGGAAGTGPGDGALNTLVCCVAIGGRRDGKSPDATATGATVAAFSINLAACAIREASFLASAASPRMPRCSSV